MIILFKNFCILDCINQREEIINEKTRRKANIDNNELIMKISSNEMKDDIVIIKNTLGYDQISSEED